MSVFHENMLIGSSGQGGGATSYQISRSLRFNSADTASLSRTVTSAGNRKTWTWAGWVKRSGFGAINPLFVSGSASNNNFRLQFLASPADTIALTNEASGTATTLRTTSALYRDPGAWMHVVAVVDTTQATAANRIKLYVNGTEVTDFQTSNAPTQNSDLQANNAGTHYIGRNFSTNYFNGYLADVYFIDGQALTPSDFGEFDANNVWQPKAYAGTYGANGFRLDFSDNSAATATTLGADRSGNGNNFTPSNLSVTVGVGNDSLVDSPTRYGADAGAGGEVRGNYCTLSPFLNSNSTLSNGFLRAVGSAAGTTDILSTFFVSSGKWYWETTWSNVSGGDWGALGVGQVLDAAPGAASASYSYRNSGEKRSNSTNATYGTAWATGDVIGVAFDADNRSIAFYLNGVSQGTAYTGMATGSYSPEFGENGGGAFATADVNFGQRPFAYAAPSGYKALCSVNLPTPTITNGATAMDTVLYTGTGATLTPASTLGFSPDLVWIKSRSAATDHAVYDVVRGAQARLEANQPDAEVTTDGGLTAFNSNGFTLGTLPQANTNTATYAAWCWDAGSSNATNTSGTITSTVRANTGAGISIVSYVGTGANATVGHGLGVAPQLVIVKNRTTAATNWALWHQVLTGTQYLVLNTTALPATGATYWNSTTPSSTVFSLGGAADVNTNTNNVIAYCFAPVAGFSAFGSYTGNASADGPFVYTGFRPRWILTKRTSGATGNWHIYDSSRTGYNQDSAILFPNLTTIETNDQVDILSNGFKLRTTGNANLSATYLYVAFAEHPFALARAR